jgi:4-coumarate--CoA ligase
MSRNSGNFLFLLNLDTNSDYQGVAALLLLPLNRGITMYIMQRFDLEQLCLNIQRHRITIIYVVPPVVLQFAKHPLIDKYNLSSLRLMHSSAAPLSHDLVRMAYNRLKVPIKQGYGMTEASPGIASQVYLPLLYVIHDINGI